MSKLFVLAFLTISSALADPRATQSSCTGVGVDGSQYSIKLAKTGETISAKISKGDSPLFEGTLKLLGQGLFVDPATGHKYEVNRYWAAPDDLVRIDLIEDDILKVVLVKPEMITQIDCVAAN